jgi:hypothetical protein
VLWHRAREDWQKKTARFSFSGGCSLRVLCACSGAVRGRSGEVMLELGASWLVQAVGLFVAALCIRLSMCLPAYKSRRWTHVKGCARTLLVFGSGGHTTEMLMLVEKLPRDRFGPVDCVLAQSDKTTMAKVEASMIDSLQSCTWHTVFRSREVKQGWASTLLTSLYALLQSFLLVLRTRPRLIICNGPGECTLHQPPSPLCYLQPVSGPSPPSPPPPSPPPPSYPPHHTSFSAPLLSPNPTATPVFSRHLRAHMLRRLPVQSARSNVHADRVR